MIDFEKYGKQKSTTPGGEVIDWNKYGASVSYGSPESKPTSFKYDVPETRASKLSRYQEEARRAEEESKRLNSPTEKYIKAGLGSVLPGAVGLGETIGGILNTKDNTKAYEDAQHNLSTIQFDLIRKIRQDKKLGKDTTNLEQLYNEGVDQLETLQRDYEEITKGAKKSTKQVVGEIGMTALDLLTAGTYGSATQGMKMGNLAVTGKVSSLLAKTGIPSNIVKQSALPTAISKTTGLFAKPSALVTRDGLKNVALGTGIGEAYDITQNLQEDKSGVDLLTGGYAKYIGLGLPAILGGAKSIGNKFNKFNKEILRDELGTAYRDTIGKYTRTQTILDNAERIKNTDPISIFKMYGKETVPEMTANGRVNPQNQIDFLKKKIGELSELKNEAVFLNDNVVSAEEYRKYIDGLIDAQKGWTEGKKLAEKKQVSKIFNDIENAQAGKDFEMNTIDKIKTEQTKLSKSYNNPQGAFSYDAHGIIGKASRDLVEMFSDDQSVRDLNKLIEGHYDAIDILNALKGKTPKGGMMSKHFGRVTGQLLGYSAGTAMGHPFLGMAGGQIIANEIQGIIQSSFITNPVKKLLITNLKEQAPKEVANILKSMEAKYGEVFDELGLARQPQSKKAGTQKLPPEESGTVPPESYIKQGLREGKELGKIMLDYAKDIKNKGGLSIQDVSRETPKGYKVGLSAVKGRIRQPLDDLAESADALVKEGKFEEAQQLFDKITQQAQKTIRDRFRGTGIEIKMEGTGFGVYKGTPEPNLDFTAIVKPGQEDLFHQILGEIANKDFLQESFLTHKPVSSDGVLGVVDKAKGIINEPYLTFTFQKPLSLKDISEVNKALESVGLEAMTLREGGSKLDLVHLTAYNGEDYGKWIKQANDFEEALNRSGIRSNVERGASETRFIGSETSGANTTYKRSESNFYSKNKDYINPDINSKVLDAIKYKKEISVGELESIVNAGDISPTEKAVFQEVLDSLKGKASKKPIKADIREPEWELLKDGRGERVGELTMENAKVGATIADKKGDYLIITNILKDGKFEAIDKYVMGEFTPERTGGVFENFSEKDFLKRITELKNKANVVSKEGMTPREQADLSRLSSVTKTFDLPLKKVSGNFKPKEINPGKIKTKEIQSRLRAKLLTLEPREAEKYASYGFDNLDMGNFDSYKSVVFDSNLKHGRGKNHFEAEGMFGHARYAVERVKTDGSETVVYIGEVQSDVFQDNTTVQHIKNFIENEKQDLVRLVSSNKENIKYQENLLESAKKKLADWKKKDGAGVKEDILSNIKDAETSLKLLKESAPNLEKELEGLSTLAGQKDKQLLIDQFVNFSRKDKYRDRLLQETINYANKTEKPKEILIATPSTVAKIEGFVGGDDFAPYSVIEGGNGRVGRDADDLTFGDTIEYAGEEMMVVDVPTTGRGWGGPAPTEIVVAPKDKVNQFMLSNWVDDEINYKTDEVNSFLDKQLPEGNIEITPEIAKKLLKDGVDDWNLERELEYISDEQNNPMTKEELKELVLEKITENENDNAWDNLRSIYGDDKVFSYELGKGYDSQVYIVEYGVNTESFGQPGSYSANIDNISDIDTNRKAAEDMFGQTQMGVLESYYKIGEEFIPKLEKILGKKIEYTEDGSGNTWWKIDPEQLKKTAFGSAPIGALVAGAGVAGLTTLATTGSKETYTKEPEKEKPFNYEKLGDALMHLESSGGTNKANADKGEMKWLTGLTEIAIKDLKNNKLLRKDFNKNNKSHIIEASVDFFKLLQKRNPDKSPAEIYVDEYWTQHESEEQRQKKIKEFNELTS